MRKPTDVIPVTDDTIKAIGGKVTFTQQLNVPATHVAQVISENEHAFDVTCTTAAKVYTVGVAAGVINGTNQVAVNEINLALAEGTATPEAIIVKVYRENTADGQDATTTAIFEVAMIAGARVKLPKIMTWGLTAVKITCSSAGKHIYGDVKVLYYTP
jgi:hypothetical protein